MFGGPTLYKLWTWWASRWAYKVLNCSPSRILHYHIVTSHEYPYNVPIHGWYCATIASNILGCRTIRIYQKNIQTPGDIEISLQSFHIPLKSIFTSMWNSEAAWWFQLLWKIWVRQLGLWHSQHMESHKINVPNHQPDGRVVTYLTIQNYHMEKKMFQTTNQEK